MLISSRKNDIAGVDDKIDNISRHDQENL